MRRVILHPHPREIAPPLRGQTITPNPRAARALGVRFISLEQLAHHAVHRSGLSPAGELVRRHTLRTAVREVLAPEDLTGYTRVISGPVTEILRAGYPREAPVRAPSPRSETLFKIASRYRDLLRTEGLIDPAEVLWEGAEAGGDSVPLWVMGYPRLGPAELAFLKTASADSSTLVLPCSRQAAFALNRRAATDLERAGWHIDDRTTEPQNPVTRSDGALKPYRFPSAEAEVRFVLTEVKRLLHEDQAPGTIALIVRDEELYSPLIHDVAWEYEVPVRASYSQPLKATSVGAWLELLADAALNDFPYETTARLLGHPLCGGLEGDVWRELRLKPPTGLTAWLKIAPALGALMLSDQAALTEHVAALEAVLEALGVQSRAEATPETAFALHKALSALESLRAVSGAPVPQTVLWDELQDVLRLVTVPADMDRQGVELHTPLAVFGASYEHVFVLGLAEGVFPSPVQEDALLDYFERAALGRKGFVLESAEEAAHRETLSFWAAIQTASRSLTLSYPERIGGSFRLPSPYFGWLGVTADVPPVRMPASLEELRCRVLRRDATHFQSDPVLAHARHALAVEQHRESAAPHDHYDGIIGVPLDPATVPLSASQLVILGSCPFRWFAGQLLGLADAEEREDTLEPSARGNLYHAALRRALSPALNRAKVREAASGRLEAAFTEAELELGLTDLPNWTYQRARHLSALRRVLGAEDFFAPGAVTISVEQSFSGVWHDLSVNGRVDRIDQGEDGLVLWDYKTSGSRPAGAKDVQGKLGLDVQLPLYVQTAAPALRPGTPVAEANYYSVGKAQRIGAPEADAGALEAFAERVKTHLREGNYPVEPDVDEKICEHCEFGALCRRGPRLARKRAGSLL